MSDRDGLLRALLEHPEDDVPRLVYADWLEENGDAERAEFIRLQCQRAAQEGEVGALRRFLESVAPDTYRHGQLGFLREVCADLEAEAPRRTGARPSKREDRLLRTHRDRWLAGLPFPVEFRRGFTEWIEVSAEQYLRFSAELDALAPVQAVGLTGYSPAGEEDEEEDETDWEDEEEASRALVGQLAACPSLERWVELEFLCCPGGDIFADLLSSPHLTNLRRLTATCNECGPAVAVVADRRFSQLRWLDLRDSDSAGGRPGDYAFIEFVTSGHLERLEYLDYGANHVADAGMEALARSGMRCLRSLCVDINYITSAGWRDLAGARGLDGLRHLDLSSSFANSPPDDGALAALLESPLFAHLTLLDITSNAVSDEGIALLARTPAAAGLRTLGAGGVGWDPRPGREGPRLSTASVRALAASRHLNALRRLVLPNVPLDDEAAFALARSRGLKGLRELVVDAGPDLGEQGRQALRDAFDAGVTIRD